MPIMNAKLDKIDGHSCIVAIGSNQSLKSSSSSSSSSDLLGVAISRIAASVGPITSLSRFFLTPAFPKGSGPDFVNAALVVRAQGSGNEILAKLNSIEQKLGRIRETRWGQRTIDIDLIAVGQEVIPNCEIFKNWQLLPFSQQMKIAPDQLILPHPRMQDRAFVLGPMMDICPDWFHPIIQQSVSQMYEALDTEDKAELMPL
jgi:2-amino-4-hydroxy-6-hydroxymethyldihydropteridine diphosphokinase